MSNHGRRTGSSTRSGLSQLSSTQLGKRIADLTREGRSLEAQAAAAPQLTPAIQRALDALDDGTKAALSASDAAQAYRSWVEARQHEIEIAEAAVRSSEPAAARQFLFTMLNWWFLLPIGFLIASGFRSPINEYLGLGFPYTTFIIYTILVVLIVPERWERSLVALHQRYDETQSALDALKTTYSLRDRVASNIKRVDPYLKTLKKRDDAQTRLKQIESERADCESILAKRKDRSRTQIPTEIKQAVFIRDDGRCQKCGSSKNIHYDHIIPYSKGGADNIENLQILCAVCNLSKGSRIE